MSGAMSAKEAIEAIHAARGQRDIVVTTMTPARDWMQLLPHPLDMVLVPSAMGHATSMGLGLALAQPDRRVIVCNGDGSMLMNLGSLASIAGADARNLTVIVFENRAYEVTGSQPTPAAGEVDFGAVASGLGFRAIFAYDAIETWQANVRRTLTEAGPVFVVLRVQAVGLPGPRSPGPARDRARRFMEALQRG